MYYGGYGLYFDWTYILVILAFVLSLIVYFSPVKIVTLVGFVFTLEGAFLTVTLHCAVLPL